MLSNRKNTKWYTSPISTLRNPFNILCVSRKIILYFLLLFLWNCLEMHWVRHQNRVRAWEPDTKRLLLDEFVGVRVWFVTMCVLISFCESLHTLTVWGRRARLYVSVFVQVYLQDLPCQLFANPFQANYNSHGADFLYFSSSFLPSNRVTLPHCTWARLLLSIVPFGYLELTLEQHVSG